MTDPKTSNGNELAVHAGGASAEKQLQQAPQTPNASGVTFRPRADVVETDSAYCVHMDLPGSREDLIDVSLEDGVLCVRAEVPSRYTGIRREQAIRAEFGIGRFERRFRLGEGLDLDALTASYRHGVLTVRVPKAQGERRRRIAVSAAG